MKSFSFVLMTVCEFLLKMDVLFHPGNLDMYYTTWHIRHTDVIILQ